MRLGLGLGISRAGKTGNYFPAAKTIITAIESRKGSAMTSAQRKAIDTFIRSETAAGRWETTIKRFFLPGWANASANAYDWVTGAVGTFVNNPTHAAGYVQGDGASKYFDFGASPNSIGETATSGMRGFLCLQGPTVQSCYIGSQQTPSVDASAIINITNTSIRLDQQEKNLSTTLANTAQTGIIIGSTTSSTNTFISRRSSSGYSALNTSTTLNPTGTTTTRNYYAMARNSAGTASTFSDARFGSWFSGLGMTTTQAEAFSFNLKNLYESLYGLTLP